MATQFSIEDKNKVPILVGVIGHRDLIPDQLEEIELKLKAVLTSLKTKYKKTPLFVVTSLAEGADFLGAKAATDLEIPLISLLPMPVEEYKTHFHDAANAAMLDTYVESSMISHLCEPVTGEGGTDDDKFARSGAAVMQYSHLVIALWDGVWTGKDSGTSFLIKHAIEGIPPNIIYELEGDFASPLDPVSTASIKRLAVDRINSPLVKDPEFPEDLDFGPEKFSEIKFKNNHRLLSLPIGDTQQKMFQHFEHYNRDQKKYHPKSGTWSAAAMYPPLVPEDSLDLLPPGLTTLRERFAIADSLAIHFQKKRHHLFVNFIIVLAAFTAFFHQIINSEYKIQDWLKLPEHWDNISILGWTLDVGQSWPYVIYGLLIFAGWFTVFFVRQRRWQQRYLDYRTVAEGIRIQFFWLIGGIRCPAVNYFLRKQLEDLEWIRGVLRLWYLRAITDDGWVAEANVEQATLIQDHWILDQLNYSKKTSLKFEKKNRVLKIFWIFLICVLFGAMLVKIPNFPDTSVIRFDGEILKIDIKWDHLFSLVGALAGAFMILVSSIHYFFNYRDLAKTCGQMAVLFSDGNKVYDPSDGIQRDERDILKELGRESLAEVGDWLLMNRKRKVKLPK